MTPYFIKAEDPQLENMNVGKSLFGRLHLSWISEAHGVKWGFHSAVMPQQPYHQGDQMFQSPSLLEPYE